MPVCLRRDIFRSRNDDIFFLTHAIPVELGINPLRQYFDVVEHREVGLFRAIFDPCNVIQQSPENCCDGTVFVAEDGNCSIDCFGTG